METVQDPNKLAYNLIHNLGQIYDNIEELIELYGKPITAEIGWWIRTSQLLGDTINQIFFKPEDYEPYFG